MASKWSYLKEKFQEAPDDPDYFAEVHSAMDARKVVFERGPAGENNERPATFNDWTSELNAVEDQIDAIERDLRAANVAKKALNKLILRYLNDQNLDKIGANGFTYSEKVKPIGKCVDRKALREWALSTNNEDLLTVNYQRLQSMVNDALTGEEGAQLPDGVEVNTFVSSVSRTKSKK